jgi:hypothetical protein
LDRVKAKQEEAKAALEANFAGDKDVAALSEEELAAMRRDLRQKMDRQQVSELVQSVAVYVFMFFPPQPSASD